MNHYETTKGERITQSQFNYRVNKAKKEVIEAQKTESGYNFCEVCGITAGAQYQDGQMAYIHASHDFGIKKGKIEQAWNKKLITPRCHRCHLDYGDGSTQEMNAL